MKKIEKMAAKAIELREAEGRVETLRNIIVGDERRAADLRSVGLEPETAPEDWRRILAAEEARRDLLEQEVGDLKQEVAADAASEAEDLVEGVSEGVSAALDDGGGATVEGRRSLARRLVDAGARARAEADALRRVGREYYADKYLSASEWLYKAADALM